MDGEDKLDTAEATEADTQEATGVATVAATATEMVCVRKFRLRIVDGNI